MALFKPYKLTRNKLESLPVKDGQLIFLTDTKEIYLDNDTNRLKLSEDIDLSNYVTTSDLNSKVQQEATARENQDNILQSNIDSKLSASNVKAGSNVSISQSGKDITISTSVPDVSDFITEEEANTAYAAKSHTHDDRYYTETEIDTKLNAKANSSHTHTAANITDFDEAVEDLIPTIPTELPNPKALTISLNGTSQGEYDGSTAKSINITSSSIGAAASSHNHSAANITSGTLSIDRLPSIPDSKITGISASKISGTISSSNLPSYVDDVLEYNGVSNFPETGESGKIYVDTATNKTYRWGGSDYVEISESLALGTTSSTAFRGDYGNTAYQHAIAKGNAYSNGLYKITTNAQGHVTAATAVTKSDITALGIPGSDTNTNTTYTLTKSGSTIALTGSDGSKTSVTDSDTNTTYSAMKGATSSDAGSTGLVPAPAAGKQTSFLRGDGTWVVPTNTTYSNMKGATTSAAGTAGLVPAPSAGAATRYLRSDGTWQVPPDTNTTYSLSSFGITATAAELNHLDGITATVTELNYVDGVTSNIQTQLNSKAASSHTHSYLPLSGGTLTGTLTSRAITPSADSTYDIGTSTVRYRNIYADTVTATTFSGTVSKATTADYWTTARTLTFTGNVTGSVSVRGNAAMSCALTLANSAVTSAKIANDAVTLAKLGSDVGTIAVQSSEPTDSNVKLWIKI